MSNASLFAADRATHLKVVLVGLFASTAFLWSMIGLTPRVERLPIQFEKEIQGAALQANASRYRSCSDSDTVIVARDFRSLAKGGDNTEGASCSKLAQLDPPIRFR